MAINIIHCNHFFSILQLSAFSSISHTFTFAHFAFGFCNIYGCAILQSLIRLLLFVCPGSIDRVLRRGREREKVKYKALKMRNDKTNCFFLIDEKWMKIFSNWMSLNVLWIISLDSNKTSIFCGIWVHFVWKFVGKNASQETPTGWTPSFQMVLVKPNQPNWRPYLKRSHENSFPNQ